MDVTALDIPARYEPYRDRLRAFIAANRPALQWKPRTGIRVPDQASDIRALREWTERLYQSGYVLQRFSEDAFDPFEQSILERELAGSGVPYILGNPLVSGALKTFGTAEQKAFYLPAMASGRHIWTQLFSEPNAGSDLTALQTRGRLDGDQYVIDGQKVWSTWAQWSDFGYLLARTEEAPGAAGITAFILDMKSPGVEVRPLREMTGTSDFNEVFLSGVRLPVINVIGQPGLGWKVAAASLAAERSGVGAGGLSETLTDLAALAKTPDSRGRPAIEDGSVRQRLGDFAARTRVHRYLGYATTTRSVKGSPSVTDAPMTKIWFSELNLEMAEYALSLLGPRAVLVEGEGDACADGLWQDRFLYARAWTIAGGSNEIMRNMIAERGLGLPREPRGDAR
jgi:alkylation response protein AidB-like acyl-CoA dehydrogenase